MGFWKDRSERKVEKLEKEWDKYKEKDPQYAALIHWEIKQERKKQDRKGWF